MREKGDPEEPDTELIKVWVIGTGPWDRSYFEDIFVEYGVALVGCSGVQKPYTPDLERDPDFRDLSRNLKSSIRTIASRMERGDLVIARRGRSKALGLGVVRGKYDYREEWAEIQGWDLYHQVRVEWLDVDELGDGRELLFEDADGRAIKPFASAYVVHEVSNRAARDWALEHGAARALEVAVSDDIISGLPLLPTAQAELKSGEEPPWFKEAARTIRDLQDAWGWGGISESSVVAHVIVPMLTHPSLGWERAQIRLEKDYVDIWVEDEGELPVLLVEVKAPRFGVSAARKQALDYYWEKVRNPEWSRDPDPWLMATNGVNLTLERPDDPGSRVGANLFVPRAEAKDFIETLAWLAKRRPSRNRQ